MATNATSASLVDRCKTELPADLPAGRYTILAGLYDPTGNQRMVVQPEKGSEKRFSADNALVVPFDVIPPSSTP